MSPFIILALVAIALLCSKPQFRRNIERDGQYLTRDWTSFVNAIFIAMVVSSHGLHHLPIGHHGIFLEKPTQQIIQRVGQLMVTTFFFYSGYGIMLSLLNRGGDKGYARMLIYPRFVKLSFNYILTVLIYFVVQCIIQKNIHLLDFLNGLHSNKLGNPTWFIIMTLLSYILTYICYSLIGKKHPDIFILSLSLLLIVAIYEIGKIKPYWWVNTIMCFPAGMLYYLKGEQLEKLLSKTKVPALLYGLLFLIIGQQIYAAGIPFNKYIDNLGGIIFALGVTFTIGSFTWRKPSRILLWLGGSGLFFIYMFHMLPLKLLVNSGIKNYYHPYLLWLCFISATCLLAPLACYSYRKLNQIIFPR